jgi:DNA repair protein RadD
MDLIEHIANLDHGQLADLLGDARLVELVTAVMRSRTNSSSNNRGQLILDTIGGPEALLEDSNKRRKFFLTLSGTQRKTLGGLLNVESVDSFSLTEPRRKVIYQWFGTPPAVTAINVNYGLFPHQTRSLLQCSKYLASETPRVMLHMPTGSGKTRTAMHLLCRHLNNRERGLVLWLVSGKELCEQAAIEVNKAWKHLGERPLPLVCAWEGRRSVDLSTFTVSVTQGRNDGSAFSSDIWPETFDDGVIIGSLETIRSLINGWEPGQAMRHCEKISLVIFDEAHRAAATTYQIAVETLAASRECGLVGLSATPGRSHYGASSDETESLVRLFGQHKVQLSIEGFPSPVEALIAQGYLARLQKERLEIVNSDLPKAELQSLSKKLETALDLPEETLKYFGLSATRNLQIIERVERLVKDENHSRLIVFAPSVESSNLIASILKSRGVNAFSVSSLTDPAARDLAIQQYKSNAPNPYVLCNYGVLTTGFDAPKTSAVVIARPTLSIVLLNQMAGRAIRGPNVGGNASATLVTVVDTAIPQLVDTINQFHAFDEAWGNADKHG